MLGGVAVPGVLVVVDVEASSLVRRDAYVVSNEGNPLAIAAVLEFRLCPCRNQKDQVVRIASRQAAQ